MTEPRAPIPFGFGGFDLNEVLRLVRSEGPLNFEVAHQVAEWVATQGRPEPQVSRADLDLMADLAHTAELHVGQATGLAATLRLASKTMGRRQWAHDTLEALRPVLTKLAERMTSSPAPDVPEEPPAGEADAMTGLLTALAPLLLGVQAGFMIGNLTQQALGRHHLPLPLTDPPAVWFVAPNLAEFEQAWQLPHDDLRFYVALHEVIHAAALSSWAHRRLCSLGEEYVGAFEIDPQTVEERLGEIDPRDPSTFETALGNPAEFLGSVRSAAQTEVRDRIRGLNSVIEGYVDLVLEDVGEPLIPTFGRIREAWHRRRVERGEAARLLEALLGIELDREDYERGFAFCRGVAERTGSDDLHRLWNHEEWLPTPAELDAPGLWLARIELLAT